MNRLHPVVNFIYFAVVLGCSMMLMHPVCLAISFVAAFCYTIQMFGYRNARKGLCGMTGVMVVAAILNPAFSHQGVTTICYLPGGNALTLESICYGIAAAFMLGAIGVQMGTRFLVSNECTVHPKYKEKVLKWKEKTGEFYSLKENAKKNQHGIN